MRQTDTVVFSFDGDKAGRRAARRALDACLPHAADNRTIKFLFLPAEHDPDSFVREFGTDAFGYQIEQALPLSQFLLNEIVADKPLDQPEGRAKALFEAKPLLTALPPNAFRTQVVHMLADRLGVPFGEVAALCGIDGAVQRAVRDAPEKAARRRVTGNEERALRNLVMYPRSGLMVGEDELAALHFAARRELFEEVLTHIRALGDAADFRLLSEVLRNTANAPVYEEIFREILTYDENVRDLLLGSETEGSVERYQEQERMAGEEFRAALARLHYDALRERCDRLSRQSKLTSEETTEYADLLRQTADLRRRLAPVAVRD
jgi:DNA primase